MNELNSNLPNSERLNISVLAKIFKKTTNSYKYLFFLSILDILHRNNFKDLVISFKDLTIEILANAWYPHNYFKLSFGTQDKIADKIDSLTLNFNQLKDQDKLELRQAIAKQKLDDICNDVTRYVPFRFIRPFFENQLRKIEDYVVNSNIAMSSNRYFDSIKPIYKFNQNNYQDCTAIIIHTEWLEYFKSNYAIVRGWASWEWLKYMQSRNPNTPALANKLFAPQKRESLASQKKYWSLVMQHTEIKCIYSDIILNSEKVSLDHYLPWSFVVHDQLWNLIPTSQSINSSKSNNLPDDRYFIKFIELQHLGLTVSYQNLAERQWNKYIESYLNDLKITDSNDLLDSSKLRTAYDINIQPLISLADIQGFSSGWLYL